MYICIQRAIQSEQSSTINFRRMLGMAFQAAKPGIARRQYRNTFVLDVYHSTRSQWAARLYDGSVTRKNHQILIDIPSLGLSTVLSCFCSGKSREQSISFLYVYFFFSTRVTKFSNFARSNRNYVTLYNYILCLIKTFDVAQYFGICHLSWIKSMVYYIWKE